MIFTSLGALGKSGNGTWSCRKSKMKHIPEYQVAWLLSYDVFFCVLHLSRFGTGQAAELREEVRQAADRLEESDAVRKELTGRVVDLKSEVRGGRKQYIRSAQWFIIG